jgi:hypothetical protein
MEEQTEIDIFQGFALELAAAGLDNREAWHCIQGWLDRQAPRYRRRYRSTTSAIWIEFLNAKRALTKAEAMKSDRTDA